MLAVGPVVLGPPLRGQEAFPPDQAQPEALNDLLMLLDELPEWGPITVSPVALPYQEPPPSVDQVDDGWMLAFMTMVDEESRDRHGQIVSELRSALMSLRRAEAVSEGELKSTLSEAAEDVSILTELADEGLIDSEKQLKLVIAEAQRSMGLFHCYEANREAEGTLAESLSIVSKRLEHLSTGARFFMSAAQTANYRIPQPTTRIIASSVAMNKLFSPKEVPLSQIRTRAREMTSGLEELGRAMTRIR